MPLSITCCDGPCCGPALSSELSTLASRARFETATCLSECELAPVVRVRFHDDSGGRRTALLSGRDHPDLAGALRSWMIEGGCGPLPVALREAEFRPGEGGGCLCDELEEPPGP